VKKKVIEIVQAAMANSENELYELKKEFIYCESSLYGDTCLTCKEFIDIYEAECKTLWKCLQWVKNAKRKKKGASY
jgi:hypothetical protein